MTDREFENKIKSSFEQITPDVLSSILADCEEKGQEKVMKESVINKRPEKLRRFASLAAVFIILFGSVIGFNAYQMNKAVSARVSLDVNPSVEIQVNKKERVLDVIPLNEDGKIIIGDMDFSGSDIDVAVNALVGSMLRNGYLSDMANSILVTVSGKDAARDAALQTRIADEIDKILAGNAVNGAILSQVLEEDKSADALAKEYGITAGKAKLIGEIVAQNSLYEAADLVPLTINELNLLTASNEIKLEDIKAKGTASDTAYIGNNAAEKIALEHAGVAAGKAMNLNSKLEWEHGKMVYDVEFDSEGYEYEYDIDATTGKVIDFAKEVDDDYRPNGTGTTASQPAQSGSNSGTSQGSSGTTNSGSNGGTTNSGSTLAQSGSNSGSNGGSTNSGTTAQTISAAEAQNIALRHAGLAAANVTELEVEFDREDNEYEVSFKAGGFEYDYDINATTGAIIKAEKEEDDDYRPSGSTGTTTTASQPSQSSSQPSQSSSQPSQSGSSAGTTQSGSAPTQSGGTSQSSSQPSQSSGGGSTSTSQSGTTQSGSQQKTLIGESSARSKALSHAGLSASQVTELEVEYDADDGEYSVSFKADGYEYDYEIDAYTGAVLKSEKEIDD